MKTYKGFNSKMKCRGFQYETGKTYAHKGDIEICRAGFHSISDKATPLSVFDYYPPVDDNGNMSRYCEVEPIGETIYEGDKVCCKKIKIGAEIGIPGIIKAHIEWVKKNLINDNKESATNTGYHSAAEVSGEGSVAAVFGIDSMVRGSIGCAIFGVERGEWNGKIYPIISVCSAIVDGKDIKVDTWYKVKEGKFVEAK